MTDTLRQQLAQYLKDALFIQNGKKDYHLVDDIMKLFEKRIDKMIEDLPEYKIFDKEVLLKVKELLK